MIKNNINNSSGVQLNYEIKKKKKEKKKYDQEELS